MSKQDGYISRLLYIIIAQLSEIALRRKKWTVLPMGRTLQKGLSNLHAAGKFFPLESTTIIDGINLYLSIKCFYLNGIIRAIDCTSIFPLLFSTF